MQTSLAAEHFRPLNARIILNSILFSVVVTFLTIFFSLTGSLFLFAPFSWRYFYITLWSKSVIHAARLLCGIRYQIKGQENLPKEPVIVLCNHQSTWETLFLQTLLPMQTWILKRELLWIPFFGWGLRLLDPIAINRKKSQSIKKLLKMGKMRLAEGKWIILFPEGTRMQYGVNKKYSKSGAALAKFTQTPILPIAHNAGLLWPKNSFLKYPGTICVEIGPLMYPSTLSSEELTDQVEQWIQTAIKNLNTKD